MRYEFRYEVGATVFAVDAAADGELRICANVRIIGCGVMYADLDGIEDETLWRWYRLLTEDGREFDVTEGDIFLDGQSALDSLRDRADFMTELYAAMENPEDTEAMLPRRRKSIKPS